MRDAVATMLPALATPMAILALVATLAACAPARLESPFPGRGYAAQSSIDPGHDCYDPRRAMKYAAMAATKPCAGEDLLVNAGQSLESLAAQYPRPSGPPPAAPEPPNPPQPAPQATVFTTARASWPGWAGDRPSMPKAIQSASLSPQQLHRRASQSVYLVVATSAAANGANRTSSLGSAVAVSRSQAITNCHVVANRSDIVMAQGDRRFPAFVLRADPEGDRCFLGTATDDLTPIAAIRDFDSVQVGERVFTIGSPRGLEQTLGDGLVSGMRRIKGRRYIQTTAPISRGSSGGGLFDANGNLIGITSFLVREAQNLNFAIGASEFWLP